MKGILFLVVGPSGAGKDTLMDGARARLADDARFVFARRAITRPADAGGEDHEAVDIAEFERRREAGGFLAYWQAHDLSYGLPIALEKQLASGKNVLANVSRAVIPEILARYSSTKVVEITAPPEILAARLGTRGRESEDDIKQRL
ncbi:MAG: phosphonate metabolism protein/1,5-bisphosphokinase (PRPP-forming) PhnN, partial [Pseudomonadota bacterium]|nr:phosphonate metabolism protein/1,5-bisphosphokinase (PRPP-forming) PhnN [Pseudomonadota bacterium]